MKYKVFTVSMWLVALILVAVGCYVRQASDEDPTPTTISSEV